VSVSAGRKERASRPRSMSDVCERGDGGATAAATCVKCVDVECMIAKRVAIVGKYI
jgi:hypothetical protein